MPEHDVKRRRVPDLIAPMLATLAQLPADDQAFGYEWKWDGLRAVGYLDNGLRLLNRNGVDITAIYPELDPLGRVLGPVNAVLDGEIVAYDADHAVSFEALQPRMHLRDRHQIALLAQRAPVTYQIFDVMFLDGHGVTALPYAQRRELLTGLDLSADRWATPPYQAGGGRALLAQAARDGMEGIVAKRLDSAYLPGRRSPTWLKIKNIRTQEVVVGGWKPGAGARAGTIGSLLLGIPGPDGPLTYVGNVGTGFNHESLAHLLALVTSSARSTSPFAGRLPSRDSKDARWVAPRIVGEVAFSEWTRDGRMRHPAWRGIRPDKRPDQVIRES
jgi:bifunctional non-homologous end joining protein LigD